jgi:hypothetical protein
MHLCVRGNHFSSFYDSYIGFWNCCVRECDIFVFVSIPLHVRDPGYSYFFLNTKPPFAKFILLINTILITTLTMCSMFCFSAVIISFIYCIITNRDIFVFVSIPLHVRDPGYSYFFLNKIDFLV